MKQSISGKPLDILLVEDNHAHAELVKRSFEQNRVSNRIIHVEDGQLALDYLLGQGEYAGSDVSLPHIVLLDLRLPKVDGLEVLQKIKTTETLQKIPVVILTTSSAEKDVAKAYEYHANSYIVKPMDYACFVSLMDDMGFYWMAWNQNPWECPGNILSSQAIV